MRTLTLSGLFASLALAGCISIDHDRHVNVTSGDQQTFVHLAIPNNKLEFNLHGGGWWNGVDRYKVALPRGVDKAAGQQLRLTQEYAGTLLPLSPASQVSVLGSGTCDVVLEMFDEQGRPYGFNGRYRTSVQCNR